MKLGRALAVFLLLTMAYLGALLYVDFRNRIFDSLFSIGFLIVMVAAISMCSFSIRAVRWLWLLDRRGYRPPRGRGYLAYLAGFALTALPGKLGELVRIRYFSAMGVPAQAVIACFFFERIIDLSVVLLLASLIAKTVAAFWVGAVFSGTLIIGVVALSALGKFWSVIERYLAQRGWRKLASLVMGLGEALSGIKNYFNTVEVAVAASAGLVAFGIQALGFYYLTSRLGFGSGMFIAIAIFPLATLVGAASMVPGGIGTTEAATVFIMHQFGASLEVAFVAAIAMRIGTLWFAIAVGIVAASALELTPGPTPAVQVVSAPEREIR